MTDPEGPSPVSSAEDIGVSCSSRECGAPTSIDSLAPQGEGRVRLTNNDRWFFIQLYRWFPSILQVLTVIRPETLVRWHRAGFRCCWRWKSRPLGGRPQIETGLRALIRRMSIDFVHPDGGFAHRARESPEAKIDDERRPTSSWV
jgi:hypothetical protein